MHRCIILHCSSHPPVVSSSSVSPPCRIFESFVTFTFTFSILCKLLINCRIIVRICVLKMCNQTFELCSMIKHVQWNTIRRQPQSIQTIFKVSFKTIVTKFYNIDWVLKIFAQKPSRSHQFRPFLKNLIKHFVQNHDSTQGWDGWPEHTQGQRQRHGRGPRGVGEKNAFVK